MRENTIKTIEWHVNALALAALIILAVMARVRGLANDSIVIANGDGKQVRVVHGSSVERYEIKWDGTTFFPRLEKGLLVKADVVEEIKQEAAK